MNFVREQGDHDEHVKYQIHHARQLSLQGVRDKDNLYLQNLIRSKVIRMKKYDELDD